VVLQTTRSSRARRFLEGDPGRSLSRRLRRRARVEILRGDADG